MTASSGGPAWLVLLALAPLLWPLNAAAESPAEKPARESRGASRGEERDSKDASPAAPASADAENDSAEPAEGESEEAKDAEHPEDAKDDSETSRSKDASANEDEPSREEQSAKLPVGVATDESGEKLVAVHFRGEPGTRYLVGPPTGPTDPYGAGSRPLDELKSLCTSPCARWLYPGSYSLALADDGTVARVPELLTVRAPAEVDGEYHSRWLWRTAGWVTMGAGILAGTLLVISSLDTCGSRDGTCLQKDGKVFLGVGAIVVGLTGGLLLTQVKDRATATVKPASPALGEPR